MLWLLLICLVLLGIAFAYWRRKKGMICAMKTKKSPAPNQIAEEEWQFFKDQMNPHFLFNSLNAIKSLILDMKNEEAADYLTDFSRLMRQIVSSVEKKSISLEEELEHERLFLSLQKLRFKEPFDFQIEAATDVANSAIRVAPMLLRPFLEYALWRCTLSDLPKKHIIIKTKQEFSRLFILLEDNGVSTSVARRLIEDKLAVPHNVSDEDEKRKRLLDLVDSSNGRIKIYDKLDGLGVITEINLEYN
jgi:LytS/YehU family sensor histidine kinase